MPDVRNSTLNKMDMVLTPQKLPYKWEMTQKIRDFVILCNGDSGRCRRDHGENA